MPLCSCNMIEKTCHQREIEGKSDSILVSGSALNKAFLSLFNKKSYKDNPYSWLKKIILMGSDFVSSFLGLIFANVSNIIVKILEHIFLHAYMS